MKKPIETWNATRTPQGDTIYQCERIHPRTGLKYKCSWDEKRFEAYCDEHRYRREFVHKGAGIYDIHLYPIETRQAALF